MWSPVSGSTNVWVFPAGDPSPVDTLIVGRRYEFFAEWDYYATQPDTFTLASIDADDLSADSVLGQTIWMEGSYAVSVHPVTQRSSVTAIILVTEAHVTKPGYPPPPEVVFGFLEEVSSAARRKPRLARRSAGEIQANLEGMYSSRMCVDRSLVLADTGDNSETP
jgi:hypothetical protein